MRFTRYKGRHLVPKANPLAGPAVAGTTIALLMSGGPASAGTHTVKAGESLSGIAARYGTSVARLARANGIQNPDLIFAGARLRVPGSGGESATRVHAVKSGDTLSSIAARYGTTIDRIVKANGIDNPNLIIEGQHLKIPGGATGASHTAASKVNVEELLEAHAASAGLNESLVKAVAWQESGWNQKARSSAGAIGIMQVMPDTADYINQVLGTGNLNVRDAADNVELGVTYLEHVIAGQGDERKGLAAYYSGPGNVGPRLKRYQRTYVDSVQALKDRF